MLQGSEQHVKYSTRVENTLDCVYPNILKDAEPSPCWTSECLISCHCFYPQPNASLLGNTQPTVKTVKNCPDGASLQLQDCFQHTDWSLFAPDIEDYTSSVLFYIRSGVETVTINKRICVFPNRKPGSPAFPERARCNLQIREQGAVQCGQT